MKRKKPANRILILLFLPLFLTGGGCYLFSPPGGRTVEDFSLATPEKAFESFKKAFHADNPVLEWRCISDELKEQEGLTWAEYSLGRGHVLEENAEMIDSFRDAEVREVLYSPDRRMALVVVEGSKTLARLELVNKPYYEIFMENDESLWGFLDSIEDSVVLEKKEGTNWIKIRVPVDEMNLEAVPDFDPKRVAKIVLSNEWKLLGPIYLDEPARSP